MKAFLGLLLVLSLFLALFAQDSARGCATAMPKGKANQVRIATESALIIWDEKTRTQHFIRRASFETRGPYFGFLVPTPSMPQLAEAPDEVFGHLEEWTQPERVTEYPLRSLLRRLLPTMTMSASLGEGGAGDVEVLSRQTVAGLDAVSLKARDTRALINWLDRHGYDAPLQLMDWLEVYVKQGWVITAFQIAKTDREADQLSTKAVRLSFRAEQPFFPYREPAENEQAPWRQRLLRLFVLSGERREGKRGDGKAWLGHTAWANPLRADQTDALGQLLGKEVPISDGNWLTVFEDRSTRRPGFGDLTFSAATDQSPVRRPPIVTERPVYLELCLLLVLAVLEAGWLGMRWLRRPRTTTP